MRKFTTTVSITVSTIVFFVLNVATVAYAEDLTSKLGSMLRSCLRGYGAIGKGERATKLLAEPSVYSFESGSALDKLQQALALKRAREIAREANPAKRVPPTAIRVNDGELTIEAGYLHWENDRDVIRLLSVAMKEGKIDRFDAGRVVGGKALNYVLAMASRAPVDKPVKFVGEVRMWALLMGKKLDIESGRTGARAWTDSETKTFEAAIEKMKIRDACLSYWPETAFEGCGDMHFSFMSNNPGGIIWWP